MLIGEVFNLFINGCDYEVRLQEKFICSGKTNTYDIGIIRDIARKHTIHAVKSKF